MPVTWLAIEPLDTLSVRDGRGFAAGLDTLSAAVFPPPSTVAGAVHEALAALGGRSRFKRLSGPLLRHRAHGLLFPWPRHVLFDVDTERVNVLRPVSGSLHDPDVPGVLAGDGEVPALMMRGNDLEAVLHGLVDLEGLAEQVASERVRELGMRWSVEPHIGLYRDEHGAAVEGYLYAAQHLRLDDTVSLVARVATEQAVPGPAVVEMGGERRHVEIGPIADLHVPAMPDGFPGGRIALYLATPAVFTDGWRPQLPDEVTLVGAAVDGPVPMSTRAQQRHVLRWAVAAGSTYLLQVTGDRREARAQELARDWHDRALWQVESRLRTSGFGWCFTGRWS